MLFAFLDPTLFLDRQIFCITSLIGQKVTASLRNNALISERVGALSIGTEVNANQRGWYWLQHCCSTLAFMWPVGFEGSFFFWRIFSWVNSATLIEVQYEGMFHRHSSQYTLYLVYDVYGIHYSPTHSAEPLQFCQIWMQINCHTLALHQLEFVHCSTPFWTSQLCSRRRLLHYFEECPKVEIWLEDWKIWDETQEHIVSLEVQ